MPPQPPFRADHVGSLLRPADLARARARHAAGGIDRAQLRAVEDRCIAECVRRQEALGLQTVTDGELRRSWWHYDFFWALQGVERAQSGTQFAGLATRAEGVRVSGRVDCDVPPMLEDFRFLAGVASAVPKMTIPAPAVLHFRIGRNNIDRRAYPNLDEFFADLVTTYRKILRAFYDAGCRYLQLDDTVWGYLCSEDEKRQSRERGDDPQALPAIYRDLTNAVLAGRPADMVVTTHVCRGNFRSTWISSGGYEPVAQVLLQEMDYDGYFLEYDSDRAGGFEPLRFLPHGAKRVVLGLVTSKSGRLEQADEIKRRIGEAARYAPIEQLCLSPQCGFASTEEGNLLAEQEQWAKLGLCVDIAREVWG